MKQSLYLSKKPYRLVDDHVVAGIQQIMRNFPNNGNAKLFSKKLRNEAFPTKKLIMTIGVYKTLMYAHGFPKAKDFTVCISSSRNELQFSLMLDEWEGGIVRVDYTINFRYGIQEIKGDLNKIKEMIPEICYRAEKGQFVPLLRLKI